MLYEVITPTVLQTHPDTEKRIAAIRAFAAAHANAQPAAPTPLPDWLR